MHLRTPWGRDLGVKPEWLQAEFVTSSRHSTRSGVVDYICQIETSECPKHTSRQQERLKSTEDFDAAVRGLNDVVIFSDVLTLLG